MDFKVYENIFNAEMIKFILDNIDEDYFIKGRAGNRINLKQKNRKDLFINENFILNKIDNCIYSKIYNDVKENFSDIKYREKWKLGKYLGDENGFYNVHRDDSDETAYRTTSMVCAFSNENDYEGGELCFDNLNVQLKLKKGSIVVFKSSLLHHVTPVTSGTRIVLISFFFDETGRKIKEKLSQSIKNFISYKPILDCFKLEYDEVIDEDKYNKTVNKVIGDIDYAESSHNIWTDKDDFWFESNDSDVLLVSFAGMGWKNSIPTFIFYNFLSKYDNIDKLFIRDISCRYYLTGLKNSTTSFEKTIELIRSKINVKKYKKIIGLGCSAGGFAAILYGQILNFDKTIAFSPQTVLTDKKEYLIGDIYNAPKTCQWLRTRYIDNEKYQKSLDLTNFQPFHRPIDIHYSVNGNKGIDKKHALYLKGTNCEIFEYPGSDHMIALTLRNNGKMKEILDKEIMQN